MGLPSGLLWSPVNIDESQPGGFAASPYQYEASFFSWGNVDGHQPTSPTSFSPWDWGSRNAEAPYYDGQVYGETPGALLTNDLPAANDIANRLFGVGWRIPSVADYTELLENCDFIDANGVVIEGNNKLVSINGIIGVRLKSRLSNGIIFFPCNGYGAGSKWYGGGSVGFYWTKTYSNDDDARAFRIEETSINPSRNNHRYVGLEIRPVFDPSAV